MSGTISSFNPLRPEPTQPVVLTVSAGGGATISSVTISVLLPGMESPEVVYASGAFTGEYSGYSATWGNATSKGFSLLRQNGWTSLPLVYVEATYSDGLVLRSSSDGSSSTTPGGSSPVTSVFGRTGAVTAQTGDYSKTNVGLGNVDNTSDVNKPVSTLQANANALALPKSGGTMSGNIAMGGAKVTGSAVPTAVGEAMVVPTSVAAGDEFRWNGTTLVRLPIGTAGQRARVNAGATAREWADPDIICTVAELATTNAPSAILRGVVAYTTDTPATYICRRTAVSTYSWVALGSGAVVNSGTLAARNLLTPAAGDYYAVTSGVATGDRYVCIVAGTWTLVSYDRSLILPGTTPWAHWPLDDASGTFRCIGQPALVLTGSAGTITYAVPLPNGRVGVALIGGTTLSSAVPTSPPTPDVASYPSTTRRCTLLGWVDYTSVTGSLGSLLAFNSSGSPFGTIALGMSNTSQVRGYYTTTANPATHNAATGTTATATAHRQRCYAAVWDGDASGTQFKLYVDGLLAYSGTPTAGTDLQWSLANNRWYVGNNPFGESVSGLYRDYAVYDDTALTAAQLREVYQRGVEGYTGQ